MSTAGRFSYLGMVGGGGGGGGEGEGEGRGRGKDIVTAENGF